MEDELRDILRNAVRAKEAPTLPLGSRLRDRFAGIGLDDDIALLRGQNARGARFRRRSSSTSLPRSPAQAASY